ncbi:MAG: YopT-type cysteine protease domain-containing protein [Candidatus Competibacterales bacterium]
MPNEFDAAATSNRCNVTVNFSQVNLLEKASAISQAVDNPSGICWGLAFVWMEYKAKNAYNKFFQDVNAWEDKATTLKAAGLYGIVQMKSNKLELAASNCGLTIAKDKEGDIKQKYGLSTSDEKDMKTLANWMSAAMGERFFFIETGGHAMAASGSKTLNLEFFDPNFGVVSVWNAGNMAGFFTDFFKQQRIRNAYWRSSYRYDLKVTKFKRK